MYTLSLIHISSIYVLMFYRIPDSIGKDIEKSCNALFPIHDVYIHKVKIIKKPKFNSKYGSG